MRDWSLYIHSLSFLSIASLQSFFLYKLYQASLILISVGGVGAEFPLQLYEIMYAVVALSFFVLSIILLKKKIKTKYLWVAYVIGVTFLIFMIVSDPVVMTHSIES